MFNKIPFRQQAVFPMQDGMIDINNNSGNIDVDLFQQQVAQPFQNSLNTKNTMPSSQPTPTAGQAMSPIIEQGRERVVQRTIVHEVPHVCPINTRIINNHVYKHTYTPNYTCTEENVCTNVQCGSCCNY